MVGMDRRIVMGFVVVVALYEALYVGFLLTGGPLIGPPLNSLNLFFPDFLVFHAAARAFIEGKLSLVYDVTAFSRFLSEIYADRIGTILTFRPFLYPPSWLLLVLPFGFLAVGLAYVAFMGTTVAGATILVGRRDWWGWLAILVSPASVQVFLAGQNTFLSLALIYGGFRLLETSPLAAGVLLGMLSYKPQLFVLLPIALLAARQWRALAAMAITIGVLSLISAGIFGIDFWLGFIEAAREGSAAQFRDKMFERVFAGMTTLFAAARIIGLESGPAAAIQAAGGIVAVGLVWLAFSRHRPGIARTAVLLAATFLVSPYVLNYDLLLLMPAALALFRRALAEGFYPAERVLYLVLWLLPPVGMALNLLGVPIVPVVVLLLGIVAWARMASRDSRPHVALRH